MKALTVRQPWASLIVHGPKHIETRSKPTKIRGRIGIIAGKHRPTSFWLNEWADDGGLSKAPAPWNAYAGDLDRWFDAMESNDGNGQWRYDYRWSRFPFGALLGTVELYDCVPIVDGPFAPSRRIQPHCAGRGLELAEADVRTECDAFSPGETLDVTDQLPYGEFYPGRWAWLLRDPQPLAEPIGMRGAQHWQEVEL